MKKFLRKSSTLLSLLLCFFGVQAQIVINEYSASNLNGFTDAFSKTEDIIELYNTSNSTVNISGWYLSDKENNPTKWQIPDNTQMPAQSHLVFFCSGRNGVFDGEYHTSFKLTQTKDNEFVVLADANGDVIESHKLTLTLVEHSHCRNSDGADQWRICTQESFGRSNNNASKINGYTAQPTIEQEAGFYDDAIEVSIVNNEAGSTLRYTLDGTNPRQNSPVYSGPIMVSSTTVVKAQSFSSDSNILPGKMDFSTFFINEDYSLAVFSVAADEVIDLANGQGELIPIGSLEYFNLDKEREAAAFGSLNRHGQDSWALPHRSLDWVTRDEMGYTKAVNAPLFGYSDRDEYQKFMFRNSGDDNYPAINDADHEGSTHVRDEYVHMLSMESGMKLDQRAVERVILFLNGQYWGVYGMRERPVDHDYTGEYYDQGKYEVQYLSTWGSTEIEYGGQQAVEDWYYIRDFILDNDMSEPANYVVAEDSINMLSLIDYMLMNLNTVASDWLNYNTGWWRGLNPEGDHKKWGYILWDLDATFDYYINYTGVPNISPDALPCDIEEISIAMDEFFGEETGTNPIDDPANCESILNGSSPYPHTDSIFIETIAQDNFCCDTEWDDACQDIYDQIAMSGPGGVANCPTILSGACPHDPSDQALIWTMDFNPDCCDTDWSNNCEDTYQTLLIYTGGGGPNEEIFGNVGKHEKIFLKLLRESPEFKQLYYQRYADLMNSTFTCENMITLLDSMIAVIAPEMPKQIERWGGTMTEWRANVDRLKNFINQRCTNLDDGALECYDELDGPYDLTLITRPDGIGEIDFNTLDIEEFPWNGSYFGGVENNIKAKVFDEFENEYVFSHWESSAGNLIFPDVNDRRASFIMEQSDTLTAVFEIGTSVEDIIKANDFDFRAFPNPTDDELTISFNIESNANVTLSLYNSLGVRIANFIPQGRAMSAGTQNLNFSLNGYGISSGLYFLHLNVDQERYIHKVEYIR